MSKIKKAVIFTDIHFGRKNNSKKHNLDCLEFIGVVCDAARSGDIGCIVFGGDWFESRTSVDGTTLHYSTKAMKMLSSVGKPVYFIVGNHDMYKGRERDVFNTEVFSGYENIQIISEPTVIDEIHGSPLLCPFLEKQEYPSLLSYPSDVWIGHFEFNDFVVTGDSIKMQGATSHKDFKHVKRILSGHFHKRQEKDNVVFIGNPFPADFSDVGDTERGYAVYGFENDEISFTNWSDGPQYHRFQLSAFVEMLEDGQLDNILNDKSHVQVEIDVGDFSSDDVVKLRKTVDEKFVVRQLSFTDTRVSMITESVDTDMVERMKGKPITSVVVELLGDVELPKTIKREKLIEIFKGL